MAQDKKMQYEPELQARELEILRDLDSESELSEAEKREEWSRYMLSFRRYFKLAQNDAAQILDIVVHTLISHETAKRTPFVKNARELMINAKIFRDIVNKIIDNRLSLLERWDSERYHKVVGSNDKPIYSSISPLCADERPALVEICRISHQERQSLLPVLEFLDIFYPFVEDLLTRSAKSDEPSEISVPFRAYITGNNLNCIIELFRTWLKMGHRENVANDEQLDPYFELFDN